jgi:hypothetical protein
VAEEADKASPEGEAGSTGAEERRQLRPYRRLVGIIFAVLIAIGAFVILRGIIRHLDRMPSSDALQKPNLVDVRALRACAEDLERLERAVRQAGGAAFSGIPAEDAPVPDWEVLSRQFVVDRVAIEARCRLNEKSDDAAVAELETASNEIDALIRAYQVLYGRQVEDVLPHALNAESALRRANAALSTR